MMDLDDVLGDTVALYGDERVEDDTIRYGPLVLSTAPKANTLLADHLFSPSLLLAERIERGLVPLAGKSVVELGAGCALPTLLAATLDAPPSVVVITDYPDEIILGNLRANVARNRAHFSDVATVHCVGFEWGKDVGPLLEVSATRAFDVVILSDLLHFDASHDVLLDSLTALLARTSSARTYVAAGKYTPEAVCARFLELGVERGLEWEEGADEDDAVWKGELPVSGGGLDREALGVRKGMCRWWVGR
ncbi:hypothetical protein BDW22DRAFT_1405258 [Trametopsis cervina]|nr:hypothetical protein BDW22DRAFT_1405258 [Trametopsis cervina]